MQKGFLFTWQGIMWICVNQFLGWNDGSSVSLHLWVTEMQSRLVLVRWEFNGCRTGEPRAGQVFDLGWSRSQAVSLGPTVSPLIIPFLSALFSGRLFVVVKWLWHFLPSSSIIRKLNFFFKAVPVKLDQLRLYPTPQSNAVCWLA